MNRFPYASPGPWQLVAVSGEPGRIVDANGHVVVEGEDSRDLRECDDLRLIVAAVNALAGVALLGDGAAPAAPESTYPEAEETFTGDGHA